MSTLMFLVDSFEEIGIYKTMSTLIFIYKHWHYWIAA
jgi:hypothetical protein